MYESLMMIDESSDINFESLVDILNSRLSDNPEMSIVVDNNKVHLIFGEWRLSIDYSDGPHVIEESSEMAEETIHKIRDRIRLCSKRFEVSSDDDPEMIYFNEYCFVQETIEQLGDIYTFDCAGGKFVNLECYTITKPWWKIW